MDPSLVASILSVQTALRQGKMRYLYGLLLDPADYVLLRERIAAIETQTKKQLITLDQARIALTQLKIDNSDVQALLSDWAAALGKPTLYGQLLPPT